MSILLLLLLFVLAWLVLILPKQRELKRHNELIATLEVGDEVMSGSGIYGTITELEGDVVWLEIAPDVEIRVARRAVASRVAETADDELDDEFDDELDDDATVDGALPAGWDTDGVDDPDGVDEVEDDDADGVDDSEDDDRRDGLH